MSCPNCDGTMQTIYDDKTITRWWCPRCGTIRNRLRTKDGESIESQTPELVKRCRRFEPTLPPNTFGSVWIEFGIAESINPPDTRMKRAT